MQIIKQKFTNVQTCAKCNHKTIIVDVRITPSGIKRRRMCPICNNRYNTREIMDDEIINILLEHNHVDTTKQKILAKLIKFQRTMVRELIAMQKEIKQELNDPSKGSIQGDEIDGK